jgi:HemY protein
MARAMRAAGDPVWTADGVVSDRWLPVSPNGRLDGFVWKLPLAELGASRPVIEFTETPAPIEPPPPEPAAKPEPAPEPPLRKVAKAAAATKAKLGAKPVEAVIPLVHAPDDPGLDSGLNPGLDVDPVPEPTSPPPRDTWQRLLQLFR